MYNSMCTYQGIIVWIQISSERSSMDGCATDKPKKVKTLSKITEIDFIFNCDISL